ncbi:MAG TPA: RasGEF domain-containing protein [Myxococcota bacterium]|nr:RasGEF domain-containing protein [Myxococcota bacterium]
MSNYLFRLMVICGFAMGPIQSSAHPIFDCIENDDIEGLEREIFLGNWQWQRNALDEWPIETAIRLKKAAAIKILVEHGSLVRVLDIMAAMKYFYGVDEEYFERERVSDVPAIMHEILTALGKDPEKEKWAPLVAEMLGHYFSRIKISILLSNSVSQDLTAKRLLYEHRSLFFQTALPLNSLIKIVRILLPLGVERYLMMLIADVYLGPKKSGLVLRQIPGREFRRQQNIETLVFAIMEQSRRLFAKMSLPAIFDQIILKKQRICIANSVAFSNKLSTFVHTSITAPTGHKERRRNHRVWREIATRLIEQGDFLAAMSIDMGLAHPTVKQSMPRERVYSSRLADMNNNYKNYREAINARTEGEFIPSIAIMMRDFTVMSEFKLFIEINGARILNKKLLNFFVEFARDYANTFAHARSYSYNANENLIKVFGDLPDPSTISPKEPLSIEAMPESFTKAYAAIFQSVGEL